MNAPVKIEAISLNAAIAAAMADVRPLAKDDRNTHGNYNFAGIDAFLDLTRPICAKHGLNVLQDEESFEIFDVPGKNGVQKMLLMRFAFTVQKDGESTAPLHRSIMVPASMGSQAFGSAQSYALKQFLRSLFQISTGEKDDIDAHDTGPLENYAGQSKQAHHVDPEPAPPKRINWGGRYPNKTSLHKALTEHQAELRRIGSYSTFDDLDAFLTSPEYSDFVATATDHAPHYLDGPLPDNVPEEFIQTFALETKTRDLIALRGNVALEEAA